MKRPETPWGPEDAPYRSDLLAGVGELTSQTEVQHVAGPTGTGEPAHGEIGLGRETEVGTVGRRKQRDAAGGGQDGGQLEQTGCLRPTPEKGQMCDRTQAAEFMCKST